MYPDRVFCIQIYHFAILVSPSRTTYDITSGFNRPVVNELSSTKLGRMLLEHFYILCTRASLGRTLQVLEQS
jgi:hypothetical protein